MVMRFRTKFGAGQLFLATILEGDERLRKSKALTHDMLALLLEGQPLSGKEKDDLEQLVVASQGIWSNSDRIEMLEGIGAACKRRRDSQKWNFEVLNIFTSEEWSRFKQDAAGGMNVTLNDMLFRVKSLGGKNLCENSKKVLVAMWLHVRGDTNASSACREVAKLILKKRFVRIMRDCKPDVYHVKLPIGLTEAFPLVYASAHPTPPTPEDLSAIMHLDNEMNCRGSLITMDSSQQLLSLPQCMLPMQHMMQHFMQGMQGMQGAHGLQGLHVFGQGMPAGMQEGGNEIHQPHGRPMRSIENGNPNGNGKFRRAETFDDSNVPPLKDAESSNKDSKADAESSNKDSKADAEGSSKDSNADAEGSNKDIDRDDIEAVLRRMLKRKQEKKAAILDEVEHNDEKKVAIENAIDDDEFKLDVPKKRKTKNTKLGTTKKDASTPKKKTTTKTNAPTEKLTPPKMTPKKKLAEEKLKPSNWTRQPVIAWERSRNQVMCRTGKTGPGGTLAFKFADHGGEKRARAKAEAWLTVQMAQFHGQ